MLSRLFFFLLVALGGAGLAVQIAWNARLRLSTESPVLVTIVSLSVSLLSLLLLWTSGTVERSFASISGGSYLGLVRWPFCGVLSSLITRCYSKAGCFVCIFFGNSWTGYHVPRLRFHGRVWS